MTPTPSDDEPRPLFEPAEAAAPDARFVRLSEDLGIWETTGDGAALLPEAPAGYLGPELTVEWTMYNPTPANPDAAPSVVQTVYPLAEGGPLVHTTGGQRYFGVGETRPGWFRAPGDLLATLEDAGVEVEFRTPAITPAGGDDAPPAAGSSAAGSSAAGSSGADDRPWVRPAPIGTAIVVVVVAAAVTAVGARRRRVAGAGSRASATPATSATAPRTTTPAG